MSDQFCCLVLKSVRSASLSEVKAETDKVMEKLMNIQRLLVTRLLGQISLEQDSDSGTVYRLSADYIKIHPQLHGGNI